MKSLLRIREKESLEIQAKVDEYLSSGGSIQVVEEGAKNIYNKPYLTTMMQVAAEEEGYEHVAERSSN